MLHSDGDAINILFAGVLHLIDGNKQSFALLGERGDNAVERIANVQRPPIAGLLDGSMNQLKVDLKRSIDSAFFSQTPAKILNPSLVDRLIDDLPGVLAGNFAQLTKLEPTGPHR